MLELGQSANWHVEHRSVAYAASWNPPTRCRAAPEPTGACPSFRRPPNPSRPTRGPKAPVLHPLPALSKPEMRLNEEGSHAVGV